MTKQFFLTLVLFCFFAPSNIYAQEACNANTISEAESYYNIGRFTECILKLKQCISQSNSFTYDDKLQAYRLIAMSYLAIDSTDAADESIVQLLLLKDDFTADSRDPERFRYELIKVRANQRINIVSSVS
ncbi:MAG: hypothetical protein K1X46_09755, partial [Chitinophagaceae bacterium]|nr:hypothetical protein [Chitinophagaceae bacterium]